MKTLRLYIVLALIAFIFNSAWEYLQLPLYTGYQQLGHGVGLIAWATAGDVMYVLAAVLFVAARKRRLSWIASARWPDYIQLAVLGFFIALFVEYKALALHRWAYTAAMPLLFGVGFSPLAQMALLVPLSVYITQRCEKYLFTR